MSTTTVAKSSTAGKVDGSLGAIGAAAAIGGLGSPTVSQIQDADVLFYLPSAFIAATTACGWTAESARTAVLSC